MKSESYQLVHYSRTATNSHNLSSVPISLNHTNMSRIFQQDFIADTIPLHITDTSKLKS